MEEMTDKKVVLDLCERIAREFLPERIILFGCYAHGTPSKDSNEDFLVILFNQLKVLG